MRGRLAFLVEALAAFAGERHLGKAQIPLQDGTGFRACMMLVVKRLEALNSRASAQMPRLRLVPDDDCAMLNSRRQ